VRFLGGSARILEHGMVLFLLPGLFRVIVLLNYECFVFYQDIFDRLQQRARVKRFPQAGIYLFLIR
jgi:hypothetical protein